MKWSKAIRKGLEAGIPAALGSAGVCQTINITNGETVAASAGAAIFGFLFGLVKNWLKHR